MKFENVVSAICHAIDKLNITLCYLDLVYMHMQLCIYVFVGKNVSFYQSSSTVLTGKTELKD